METFLAILGGGLGAGLGLAVMAQCAATLDYCLGHFAKARRQGYAPLLCGIEAANQWLCRRWHNLAPRTADDRTLPAQGPVLLVALHRNSMDPFMIHAQAGRRVAFLVAGEFATLPVVGAFLRLVGCIPVNRQAPDAAALRVALRALRDGQVVGIFPEGGINHTADARPIRLGVGMLALRSGAPVIPTGIVGIRPRRSVLGGLLRPTTARVRFGPPVALGDLLAVPRPTHEHYQAATDRIMAAVRASS